MLFISCATHFHTVGIGPQAGVTQVSRQYYLIFGLVPLNSVDTNEMADSAENYEIQTQTGPIDIAISVGLGIVTFGFGPAIIQSRTVTVTK